MKIGFIGLGMMGASMASNLQKSGFDLVVNDLQRQAASAHLNAGATWAETPKAVAEKSDVILTSLPGPADVEAVVLGKDGLMAGMKPGTAIFDLTTNAPSMVRRLHKVLAEKGLHLLDAPVSGGPSGAKSGKLAIWVGGDNDVFEKNKHVLDGFSDAVITVLSTPGGTSPVILDGKPVSGLILTRSAGLAVRASRAICSVRPAVARACGDGSCAARGEAAMPRHSAEAQRRAMRALNRVAMFSSLMIVGAS